MQRFREHSLTCGGGSSRLDPLNRIREPAIASGLPIATVTGTIQHAGVKRHVDEDGQRQRVVKGMVWSIFNFSSLCFRVVLFVGTQQMMPLSASTQPSPAPTTNPGHGVLVSCGVCGTAMRTITSFFLHWLDTHSHLIEILEEVSGENAVYI